MQVTGNDGAQSVRRDPWKAGDADECGKRAIECYRNAGESDDELLATAYFQLARLWRVMSLWKVTST